MQRTLILARSLACVLLATITGCASPTPEAQPQVVTRESSPLGGEFITLTAAGGERLTISCESGHADWVQWAVGQPPSTPPPLAGVYFAVAVDGAPAEQIEASWFQKDQWGPRKNGKDLAVRIAKAKHLILTPPAAYTPGKSIEWHAPAELKAAWCASKKPPARQAG